MVNFYNFCLICRCSSIGCDVQIIPVDLGIVHSMVERHASRTLFVNEEVRVKHLAILKGYDEKCKN